MFAPPLLTVDSPDKNNPQKTKYIVTGLGHKPYSNSPNGLLLLYQALIINTSAQAEVFIISAGATDIAITL